MRISKLLQILVLLAGVWVVNLLLLFLTPGDITSRYWSPEVKREVLERMRADKGVDLPFSRQFLLWTNRLVHGDLGYSWQYHRPVWDIFKNAIPASLQLAVLALIFNVVLGCLLGIIAALLAGRSAGVVLDGGSLILYATPTFWLAISAIYVFSLKLHWLPNSGMRSVFLNEAGTWEELRDRIEHLILPATLLGIAGAIATMRYVRGRMIEILRQPFILLAYAKGFSKTRVLVRHAFRNALLPVITQIGLSFPILLSGAFVIEVVFAWPGMGRVTYEAIFAKDYPIILAANFLTACLAIAGNVLADVLYRWIDPRVRTE